MRTIVNKRSGVRQARDDKQWPHQQPRHHCLSAGIRKPRQEQNLTSPNGRAPTDRRLVSSAEAPAHLPVFSFEFSERTARHLLSALMPLCRQRTQVPAATGCSPASSASSARSNAIVNSLAQTATKLRQNAYRPHRHVYGSPGSLSVPCWIASGGMRSFFARMMSSLSRYTGTRLQRRGFLLLMRRAIAWIARHMMMQ